MRLLQTSTQISVLDWWLTYPLPDFNGVPINSEAKKLVLTYIKNLAYQDASISMLQALNLSHAYNEKKAKAMKGNLYQLRRRDMTKCLCTLVDRGVFFRTKVAGTYMLCSPTVISLPSPILKEEREKSSTYSANLEDVMNSLISSSPPTTTK